MAQAPITVCIGTFGDQQIWSALAHDRAMASVDRQTLPPAALQWCHGENLHDARNAAAARATSEWLCFLDADDELDPAYLEAMASAIADFDGMDMLLQPATLGVHPDGHEDPFPVVIPTKPLLDGNYLVIGTLVRREQFCRVGGFCDFPLYEDWDLWLRCWLDGATVLAVPSAIYRVHVNENGRNSAVRAIQMRAYHQVRNQYVHR
jgi:glycosyltransferase involved in cell wall biosynthesis